MITIITAPPRYGKTSFMTHLACQAAFDRQRNRLMQNELQNKIASGFDSINTIPTHCVSANYDISMHKFGYTPRACRRINPYRLGFKNKYVDVHFNLPYEFICITEAQKYLNSRLSRYFPSWQSRWYEQHGHNNLDIFLDTQRPMLIDANVRELSKFVEIVDLNISKDCFSKPSELKWTIRRFDNSWVWDRYLSSGKKDSSCYIEDIEVANYNVFNCYDSQSCKPKFYDGHFDEDIDYNEAEPFEESIEAYIAYLKKFDDEMPENYIITKGVA